MVHSVTNLDILLRLHPISVATDRIEMCANHVSSNPQIWSSAAVTRNRELVRSSVGLLLLQLANERGIHRMSGCITDGSWVPKR